ncbi:MAG: type II toxin-antitoxin system PemK/MazF family toxin [Dehalococcoidia bacterium]|nr:type II toxin-antitoxin system PemK/MazF family toxin [Dehalococcoidia bacterium]
MRRGELYRVRDPRDDPKSGRVFVIVSRPELLKAPFPYAICAPVHSRAHGLDTQVAVGPAEGLKHDSWVHCDSLTSIRKRFLTDYIGRMRGPRIEALNRGLVAALELSG